MNKIETKYTKDGKKVVVLGVLNGDDRIVQELFINESNDEIPGGKRFTTSELFDEKVESVADSQIKQANRELDRIRSERRAHESACNELRKKLKGLQTLFKFSNQMISMMKESDLNKLKRFLCGSIQWVVFTPAYGMPSAPTRFEDAIMEDRSNESWNNSEIKLITMFGRANGDLCYRINQYSDGSGSGNTIEAFDTREDAIDYLTTFAKHWIDQNKMSLEAMVKFQRMGCVFTKGERAAVKEMALSKIDDSDEQRRSRHDKEWKTALATREEAESFSLADPT